MRSAGCSRSSVIPNSNMSVDMIDTKKVGSLEGTGKNECRSPVCDDPDLFQVNDLARVFSNQVPFREDPQHQRSIGIKGHDLGFILGL
jgi:hypothetical protein